MRNLQVLSMILLLFCCSVSRAQQPVATNTTVAVPPLMNFSGVLTESNGRPISAQTPVTFMLYKESQGGSPLWMESQNVKPDSNGNYSVMLGATSSQGLPAEIFVAGQAHWLAVQVQGQQEQPRVLLVSTPYAFKAGDAQTLGGLPASAFVLAAPLNGGASTETASESTTSPVTSSSTQSSLTGNTPVTTAGGTTGKVPLWDSSSDITSSIITQTGSGSSAKLGINVANPLLTLDVNGSELVRGMFEMATTGFATASKGFISNPLNIESSAFNSSTSKYTLNHFQWQAEPVGNNTAHPGATLNLLYGQDPNPPKETGLKLASNGVFTFASGQTFPGTGTITGVSAGTGLVGGGTGGAVTLSVDPSQVPFLNTGNNFSGSQFAYSAGSTALTGESSSGYGVYGSSSTGTGVSGSSSSSYGIYGSAPVNYGVVGVSTSGNGVYGQISVAPQAGVVGRTLDASGNWAVYAFGNFGATGTKSSVVPVDNGKRQVALYAVESPGVWFEDYGSGRLVSGVAIVKIDPAYAQTVNTGVEYHVFVTPAGDCQGLYVTARTATGFEVRELQHGKSNVGFDYRIIALRRGYESKRLADVTNATPSAIEVPR